MVPKRLWTALTLALCVLAAANSAFGPWVRCAMGAEMGPCCCHSSDSDDNGAGDAVRTGPCCCSVGTQDRQSVVAEAPRLDGREGLGGVVLPVSFVLSMDARNVYSAHAPLAWLHAAGPPLFLRSGAWLI